MASHGDARHDFPTCGAWFPFRYVFAPFDPLYLARPDDQCVFDDLGGWLPVYVFFRIPTRENPFDWVSPICIVVMKSNDMMIWF